MTKYVKCSVKKKKPVSPFVKRVKRVKEKQTDRQTQTQTQRDRDIDRRRRRRRRKRRRRRRTNEQTNKNKLGRQEKESIIPVSPRRTSRCNLIHTKAYYCPALLWTLSIEWGPLNRNPSKTASFLHENVENVQIFPSAGLLAAFVWSISIYTK